VSAGLDEVRDDFERDPRHGHPPEGRDPFAVDEDRTLGILSMRWHLWYELGVDRRGRWVALRRDGKGAVIAEGPDALQAAIAADYAADPVVPR
jgi:hypothetical protein